MTEKEAQAKQLDSVTDRVEEQEVDLGKAQMAMSALGGAAANGLEAVAAVSAADVQVICDELEVTEEAAQKVLQQVAAAGLANLDDHDAWVAAALRFLITQEP